MSFAHMLAKLFGSRNQRYLKRARKVVAQVNELEAYFQSLSAQGLKDEVALMREQLKSGTTLDALLPRMFAAVRESGVRTLNMRHFDVQLIGGLALHEGKIAEMQTGEGKTLVATLAVSLNALQGRGVHVVTVNDYLAKRDAAWMSPLYEALGLTCGVVVSGLDPEEKKAAYGADITYGTNNEFGFDYLRDNMALVPDARVQRDLAFAVIDEVDSILIDESRTPLIISGKSDDSSELYLALNKIVPALVPQESEEDTSGHFLLDEKAKQVLLSEAGHEKVEGLLVEAGLLDQNDSLYAAGNINILHHLHAALRAHHLFTRDVDYIVRQGEVVIVDEHTGRMMSGRRWSDGLHQAVEAKESVEIQSENQTLASITFQNYFRQYEKLAGMTGTADTEASEFQSIYHLDVVAIPSHLPSKRVDKADLIYMTVAEKYRAIVEDVKASAKRDQPVLLGTASIEASEVLSGLLQREKIPHQVLNAKFHEKEAHIIAQAGKPGCVTIATNMAGRGTDIVLGGNLDSEIKALGQDPSEEAVQRLRKQWEDRHQRVIEAGGLRVIGSERHEARRIDNQLRGRAGRQGDPGSTQFYLSLEDKLMRIFASPRLAGVMQKLGLEENEAIESRLVTRAIENAQRKVEGHNFDSRKQLLEYDDVANEQRKVVYEQRDTIMRSQWISETVQDLMREVIGQVVERYVPPNTTRSAWQLDHLEQELAQHFTLQAPIQSWLQEDTDINAGMLRDRLVDFAQSSYRERTASLPAETITSFERSVMLRQLDQQWKDHLNAMDHLRQGINLRGYAQKDPKQEFKRESFALFTDMLENIKLEVVRALSRVKILTPEQVAALERERQRHRDKLVFSHPKAGVEQADNPGEGVGSSESGSTFVRGAPKPGRNERCHCGSGKKYKHCCGKIEA